MCELIFSYWCDRDYTEFSFQVWSLSWESTYTRSREIPTYFQYNKASYLQSHLWYLAPFNESTDIDVELYRYVREEDDLHSVISGLQEIPDTFRAPCQCKKCAHENVHVAQGTYHVVNIVNAKQTAKIPWVRCSDR